MNQILSTNSDKSSTKTEKKSWFKFQFIFSIVIITILIGFGFFYLSHLGQKEDFSNSLIANYNIYKLYNSKPNTSDSDNEVINNDLFRNYRNSKN